MVLFLGFGLTVNFVCLWIDLVWFCLLCWWWIGSLIGGLSGVRVCLFVVNIVVCWLMLFCLVVFSFGFWVFCVEFECLVLFGDCLGLFCWYSLDAGDLVVWLFWWFWVLRCLLWFLLIIGI